MGLKAPVLFVLFYYNPSSLKMLILLSTSKKTYQSHPLSSVHSNTSPAYDQMNKKESLILI